MSVPNEAMQAAQQQPDSSTGMMGAPMDTKATANKPQSDDMDTETYETMVAGLRDYVFGQGEQGIVERMSSGEAEIGQLCGEIVYGLVQEAAHQAEAAGHEIDMDIIMGVATQIIDDIADLMGANGITMQDKDKEFALLYAQQLYVEQSSPTDEQRDASKQDLATMKKDGDVDTATEYVQMRGQEAGADPFGVEEMPGGGQRMMNQ